MKALGASIRWLGEREEARGVDQDQASEELGMVGRKMNAQGGGEGGGDRQRPAPRHMAHEVFDRSLHQVCRVGDIGLFRLAEAQEVDGVDAEALGEGGESGFPLVGACAGVNAMQQEQAGAFPADRVEEVAVGSLMPGFAAAQLADQRIHRFPGSSMQGLLERDRSTEPQQRFQGCSHFSPPIATRPVVHDADSPQALPPRGYRGHPTSPGAGMQSGR
ncbi:hypothetical protein D3C87_827660 [compost metagenome]